MQSSLSTAAALQHVGLVAAAPPAAQPQQPLQQQQLPQQPPMDQGSALLANLQNQARSRMGQLRPQDASGAMLLQMLQQQQQHQVFPGAQPMGAPGHLGQLGAQQGFAPAGQAQRPSMPPFSPIGGAGAQPDRQIASHRNQDSQQKHLGMKLCLSSQTLLCATAAEFSQAKGV